jgi:hypothetical protein
VLAQRQPQLAARLAASGESLDAACLARWLKARGGSLESAAQGILAHADWRESFVGAGGVAEASIPEELAAQKAFLQGCDAAGYPVVVVKAARWVLPLAPGWLWAGSAWRTLHFWQS